MHYLESVLEKDNSCWKYLITIIISFISILLIGGIFTKVALALYIQGQGGNFSPEMFSDVKNLYNSGLSENFILILMLFPFVTGMIISWLLVRGIHKRTFSMTVNGRENIRWSHVFTGFLSWFLLMFVFGVISYIADPNNFVLQFDSRKFIPLLIISLLFIPVQTTFEEYIFRGYLAQGVAAWTRSRWLTVCIPGLLFGLMHYANTEVAEHGFWLTMSQYIIFGLFFGLTAVLDDGIELSIGMHAANNLFVCLFITNEASSLRTPAIFSQTTVNSLSATVGLVVAASLAVLFFYRKYNWNLSILNKTIR
jgi:membrane protease YdiL (CAAX protease family)